MKKCAILQSNYIPWKGYFDLIAQADIFVIFDSVQYTKSDWRNRNRIKTARGLRWLTVPVSHSSLFTCIYDKKIAGEHWREGHLQYLRQSYESAPYYSQIMESLEPFYRGKPYKHLSDLNIDLIKAICQILDIRTTLLLDRDLKIVDGKNEKLISICTQLGADVYLSGPAASSYLDKSLFEQNGIEIEYVDYEGYKTYHQLYPPFEHKVTILDLLFHEGPRAREHLKGADRQLKELSIDKSIYGS